MVASKFILDAAIQFKLGCRNRLPIQTLWPGRLATGFESVLDSLGGTAPELESDGRIRCKLGCDHPSQHCWQCQYPHDCWQCQYPHDCWLFVCPRAPRDLGSHPYRAEQGDKVTGAANPAA
ncbi:hypothetical protein PCASD_11246 [Puccinia coronata f. sp. avenae]|uniref:Uncharacterized protein n=1 Tax=Puccinia coronata f. sp. avenae TaxID=200324 RepID=A0A2N5UBP1_9BASI|nr:hypothetical protein PCASD_11246 [Puccinia coronata f. sp. avenae]